MINRKMAQLYLIVACCSWLVCCFNSVTLAQSTNEEPDEWKQDARLSGTVSLRVTGTSLQDTLIRLRPAGVQLKVDADLAEQKAQIVVYKRPLTVIMASLAEIFRAEWRPLPDHAGYKLTMKLAAARYRSRWWAIFEQERQRTLEYLTSDLIAAMNTPLPPYSPERDGPRNPSGLDHHKIQAFFAALGPSLQQQIASMRDDSYSYNLFNPVLIPNEDEGALLLPVASLPEPARNALLAQRPDLPSDSVIHFAPLFDSLNANVFASNGTLAMSTMVLHPQHMSAFIGMALNQSTLLSYVNDGFYNEKSIPPTWKQLLAYQRTRVWPNDVPKGKAPLLPPRRAEVLDTLAQQQRIEFIADYHSNPGRPMGAQQNDLHLSGAIEQLFSPALKPENGKRLADQLNARALEQDMSWKQQDGLYLFRDNRWYRDDLLEVSAARERDWLKRYGSLTKPPTLKEFMDEKAEFVSHLTRWQLANGLRWIADEEALNGLQPDGFPPPVNYSAARSMTDVYPFYSFVEATTREYHLIAFYAGLSDEQRKLLCGGALPPAQLTPEQRQQATGLCPTLLLQSQNPQSIMLRIQPSQHGDRLILSFH